MSNKQIALVMLFIILAEIIVLQELSKFRAIIEDNGFNKYSIESVDSLNAKIDRMETKINIIYPEFVGAKPYGE